eukprot:844154-Ditylum_brightwellii.AAC.1
MLGHLKGCGAIVGKYYMDWTSVVSAHGFCWFSDAMFYGQSTEGGNGAKESWRTWKEYTDLCWNNQRAGFPPLKVGQCPSCDVEMGKLAIGITIFNSESAICFLAMKDSQEELVI